MRHPKSSVQKQKQNNIKPSTETETLQEPSNLTAPGGTARSAEEKEEEEITNLLLVYRPELRDAMRTEIMQRREKLIKK